MASTARKQATTKDGTKEKPAGAPNESFLSDFNDSNSPRIGDEYQAQIPDFVDIEPEAIDATDKSLLLWKPPYDADGNDVSKLYYTPDELYEYECNAICNYGYSLEQALGLLQFNKYDIDKSKICVAKYKTVSDKWSKSDRILFEQAFHFNGKNFARIQQMLPNKPLTTLIQFYYNWKKRSPALRQTHLDHCNKRSLDSDDEDVDVKKSVSNKKNKCTGCKVSLAIAQLIKIGENDLCNTCYLTYRKTGSVPIPATINGIDIPEDVDDSEPSRIHRPPPKMNLNLNDFKRLLEENNAGSDVGAHPIVSSVLRSNSHQEVQKLKFRAWKNRQHLAIMRAETSAEDPIAEFRQTDASTSTMKKNGNGRWSQEDKLLVVQCFRTFGKQFDTISEVMGGKSAEQVKTFFNNPDNRGKYNLDSLVDDLEEQKRLDKEAAESKVISLSDDEGEASK